VGKDKLTQTAKELHLALELEKVKNLLEKFEASIPMLNQIAQGSKEMQEYVTGEITKYAMSIRSSKINKDELEPFFTHPYLLYKERRDKENEWHLAIPKFIDSQFGWLEKITPSYNIFLINRYADWLGELPQTLKNMVGYKDPLDVFLDGDALIGKDINKVADKYKSFIKSVEKDRLIVDKSKHFELLAALIKDGILPFIPKPVDSKELVNLRCDFELRDYQQEAWKYFLQYSNIGAFFPPSTGKTYLSIYTMTRIKGPHLVVCPSKLLVEQWIERIELYTDLKVGWWDTESQRKHVIKEFEQGRIDVIVCTYQSAIKHCHGLQFQLLTIDEVHHLPANEFSKLAVLKRIYTMGLSATPQREDQREEYIFALTGKPVGLSWDKLKHLGIIQSPTMNVWIVKNEQGRLLKLGELLQEELKTIIFCDSIELGKTVSKRFGIPHVYGNTKQRLDILKEALVSVVSRVGDEGVSLPDIKRVIEIDWLFGSRRQELQRFTRLLHGKTNDGEGHLIMTIEQYQHDHKRLFGIMDRGFKIVLHREGISEKVIENVTKPIETKSKTRSIKQPRIKSENQNIEPKVELSDSQYPLLKYAGIKKIVESLNSGQKKVILFLIDPQNQNQSFTMNQIAMSLGYKNPESLRANGLKSPLPFLVKKGYVTKTEDKFKQNFSSMI